MRTCAKFTIVSISLSAALFILACQPKTVRSEEPVTKPIVAQPTPAGKSTITIAAVGDIMMGSTFPDDTRLPPDDGAGLFQAVAPILSAADIAFGNLEGPIIDDAISTKCSPKSTRCFAFKTPTRYGKYLKEAGFDVMSLANNHAADFGDAGRISTRRVLDSLGIKHAGSDLAQFTTAYLTVKGRKVAFIGFAHNKITPNVNNLTLARQLVAQADKQADIVVVSFHGGAEGTAAQNVPNRTEMYVGEARGNLPAFARAVIDAGADLVLGHGPHVLRGLEIYKGRLVAYSLGNFCTYGWFQLIEETALTMILEVELDAQGRFVGGTVHAGKQVGRGIPVLDEKGTAIRVVRNLSKTDFGPNAPLIAEDGTITENTPSTARSN